VEETNPHKTLQLIFSHPVNSIVKWQRIVLFLEQLTTNLNGHFDFYALSTINNK
jgi:hypothetical protein